MANFSDYLLTSALTGKSGFYVRLLNNSSGTSYISDTVTDVNGKFTFNPTSPPPGSYTVFYGLAATVPGTATATADANYLVPVSAGDDAALRSLTVSSGPYNALARPGSQAIAGPDPWYDTNAYAGVDPAGASDSTAGIVLALAAAAAGGVVLNPSGTYLVGSSGAAFNGTWNIAYLFLVRSGMSIRGAGISTIFKVANNVPTNWNYGALFSNDPTLQAHDISFQDFLIDMNGGNQLAGTHFNSGGVCIYNAQNVKHTRVSVKDSRSEAGFEGAHFNLTGCFNASYIDCDAYRTSGSGTSVGCGFACSQNTEVQYTGCRAMRCGTGGGNSQGFSAYQSRHIKYGNCSATECGLIGFNCETSEDVDYVNCASGELTSHYATSRTGTQPYPIDTALGNGNQGWLIQSASNRVKLVNCIARKNTLSGLAVGGGAAGEPSNVRIHGGSFIDNATYGMEFYNLVNVYTTRITGGPFVSGNTTAQMRIFGTNYAAVTGNVAAPVVPASTVALQNPFPFDMTVAITPAASTCAIAISGVATGIVLAAGGVGQAIRLAAGQTIALTYANVPAWVWYVDN